MKAFEVIKVIITIIEIKSKHFRTGSIMQFQRLKPFYNMDLVVSTILYGFSFAYCILAVYSLFVTV
jgi:hypothetical protein